MRYLFSVFLLLFSSLSFATEVGPFNGTNVGNSIKYTSTPTTTYTKMVEQAAGTIANNASSYGVPNSVRTTIPTGGLQIEAKLVTEIPKTTLKETIKNGIKGGKFTPQGIAAGLAYQWMIDKAIQQGLTWMSETQTWVATPLNDVGGGFQHEFTVGSSTYTGSVAQLLTIAQSLNPTLSNFNWVANSWPAGSGTIKASDASFNYNLYNTVKTAIPVTTSTIDSAASAAADSIVDSPSSAGDVLKAADKIAGSLGQSLNVEGLNQSATPTTPSVETAETVKSKTTTKNADGTETTKEVRQKTVVTPNQTTNNSTVNNSQVTYNIKNVYNTYTNGSTTPSETSEEEDAGTVPPQDPPDFKELEKPKDFTSLPSSSNNFINALPWIPSAFSCTNPSFPFMSISFDLPLCQWIEKFRVLFEWFWNVITAIGIYLLIRSVNPKTGAIEAK